MKNSARLRCGRSSRCGCQSRAGRTSADIRRLGAIAVRAEFDPGADALGVLVRSSARSPLAEGRARHVVLGVSGRGPAAAGGLEDDRLRVAGDLEAVDRRELALLGA